MHNNSFLEPTICTRANLSKGGVSEDWAFGVLLPEQVTVGVFDGIGGSLDGEKASKWASNRIRKYLFADKRTAGCKGTADFLHRILRSTESDLRDLAKRGKLAREAGTTATVGLFCRRLFRNGWDFAVASAGDSRAYAFLPNNLLACLTLDNFSGRIDGLDQIEKHLLTTTQPLLSSITSSTELDSAEKELSFRQRNIVQNPLLAGDEYPPVELGLTTGPLPSGTKVILTSDGIHDNLTDAEIQAIMANPALIDKALALVQAARMRSVDVSHVRAKDDDLTAIVALLP